MATTEKTIEIPEAILKASNMKYDNTASGLAATNAQAALDEIKEATDAAQSTANTGKANAATAQNAAEIAQSTADTAKTNAATAQAAAEAAQSTANAAQTAAANAKTSANAYTDEKIAALINGAPSTLDTLKEIADAMAESQDVVEALEQSIGTKAAQTDLEAHTGNTSNPHGVTKAQVGLGNVPNVATNDQTPTFTTASANANLTSGEKLSVAFGKIAKAISSLISHLSNTTAHITAAERTSWNGKQAALGYTPLKKAHFVTEMKYGSQSSVASNNAATLNVNVAKSGYTPIGIMGFSTGSISVTVTGIDISGTTAALSMINWSGGSATVQPAVRVLYVQNV